MAATLTCRVYTGTGAGTESASQTGFVLCDADALTGGAVDPGTNSFERWLRLRVDVAPVTGVSVFWFQNQGDDLPDGVTIKYGVTDTPATPVATTSAIATHELGTGKVFFDMNTYSDIADHTRYLVLQAVVAADADSGAIPQQDFTWGWQEN